MRTLKVQFLSPAPCLVYMKNKININRIKDLYYVKGHNVREVAKRVNISFWQLYNIMDKNNMPRRSYSEANYLVNKDKPKFKTKDALNNEEQNLKIAGSMLYWAEGTLKGCTVDFANSSPDMVKVFLKFLREICGTDDRRLRIYLYTYDNQDIQKLKAYWSAVTRVPTAQFTKPYVRAGNPNLSARKLLYGLIHVRYNDKRLLEIIKAWIHEYIAKNCGEIPERPNGPDCGKRSVLKKFRMEKRVNSGEPLKQKL